uniref:WAT1-related protein n=1 Tax=Oryza punctata TaxID=4537 RepID=A0A0E0MLG0_ORYPU
MAETTTTTTKPWMAEGLLLKLSMVLVQLFTIGALLLAKLSFNSGMAPFVLLAYRNLIGAVTVLPFAFWFEREMMKKVNYKVLGWNACNALFGIVLAMGLHYYGLRATNAGYTVNFLNLVPVVTFIIAVIFRLEKLKLKTRSGMIRVIGTVICVVGTMVVSLYKGKLLHLWPTHLLKPALLRAIGGNDSTSPTHHNMLTGTLFLCGSCLSYAFWFIVQGVFNTAATFCLITWAVSRRGPTYPSMFNSLSLIITVVLDSMLLGSDISVGSLLGAFMIITGLYAFLWGKGKEVKRQQQVRANTDADQRKTTDPTSNGEVRIQLDT